MAASGFGWLPFDLLSESFELSGEAAGRVAGLLGGGDGDGRYRLLVKGAAVIHTTKTG